jgi:transketolase C-terminal domain/subunit
MTHLTKRDIEMLKLMSQMEIQVIADKLHMKTSTIYSRLAWLRKKKEENQTFVNQLYNFEKTCPKVKKLLTSGERNE